MIETRNRKFAFAKGDVVLAKYEHEIFYAKVLKIFYRKKYATLLFDDESVEKIAFRHIYDVNETTSAIICIVCKDGRTSSGDDIVLCDQCNVGFHQKCHDPIISSDVLKPDIPWECCYCAEKTENPHVESNPFDEKVDNDNSSEESETEKTDSEKEEVKIKAGFEELSIEDDNVFEQEENDHKREEKVDSIAIEVAMVDSTSTVENEVVKTEIDSDATEVVIADSTTPMVADPGNDLDDDEDENLIIDVESDDDCPVTKESLMNENQKTVCSFKSNDFLKNYLENKEKSLSSDFEYIKKDNSVTDFNDDYKNINKYGGYTKTLNTFVTQSLDSTCRSSVAADEIFRPLNSVTCQTKIYKPKILHRCCSESTQHSSRKTKIFHPYSRNFNLQEFTRNENQWWSTSSEPSYYTRNDVYSKRTFSVPSYYTPSDVYAKRSSSEPSYYEPSDVYAKRPSSVPSDIKFETERCENKCLTCGNVSDLLCYNCRSVSYCSRQCQLADWNEHLHECNAMKYH